ncbi:MAG: ATP-binding protein [Planctomycetota bacterium]
MGTTLDDDGLLWCAAPRMLFAVNAAEIDLVADGVRSRCHCWVLPPRHETDFLEGLATPACAMLTAGDGTLLAALQTGMVVCDPRLLPKPHVPSVSLRRVSSNDVVRFAPDVLTEVSVPPQPSGGAAVSLPAFPHRVEIDFAADTLAAPTNALVEYRLDGIDDAWIAAPLQGRAAYPTLPAGIYRFRLRSSDHATRWTPEGPTLTLVVAPPVWETLWFRTLALATVAAGAAGAALAAAARQGRQRVARLRQQAAIDGERIRLARDMHDEVGTNLTQIALLAEVAKDDAAANQVERLETMARISRETVAALDELVWTVDPGNDTLAHLLSYACRSASETLREFGVKCDVESPTDLPLLATPGRFRRGVLLIVKEAVTNVLAHARARRVVVRIAADDGRLKISIADDGEGITSTAAGSGAGLGNMRHRAWELGGSCRVEPGPAGGTVVAIDLPLASIATANA